MGKLTTERINDALFVYSAERLNDDDEPQIVGVAALNRLTLSDGSLYIEGKFTVKPYCQPDEIAEVKRLLLDHISS